MRLPRRIRRMATVKFIVLAIAAAILCGCTSSQSQERTASRGDAERATAARDDQPLSASDPCAVQLHELCGPLLMYYSLNKRLPQRIDDLRTIAGPDPNVQFNCPHSGKAYVYDPIGISWPNQRGRAVIYDPEPSHAGMRWTVMIEEGPPGTPLVTRVVAFPDSRFTTTTPGALDRRN